MALLNALAAFDATLFNAAFASLDLFAFKLVFELALEVLDVLELALDVFELVLEALEVLLDVFELVLDALELTALEVLEVLLDVALEALELALELLCFLMIKLICISASIPACLISAFTLLYSPCDGF